MPKVEAFHIEGLQLKFNSLDHMMPHLHVIKPGGKWEIRVYFLSCTDGYLNYDYKKPPNPPSGFRGITAKEKGQILEKVLEKRTQLLSEWEKKVNVTENYNAHNT